MSGEPQEFGPYTLTRLIGRGGMGEVFEAYDRGQDRVVAVKRLVPHLADDVEFQRRFQRESKTAARLRNPHVVPIHRYGEIDGQLFIEMRLVDGADLEDVIEREGSLSPERAVSIVEQVASALDAAHGDGLIHRDIKPSNILLDNVGAGGREFVYLADFGITRAAAGGQSQSLTSSHAIIGSLDYMAPEQFDGTMSRSMDIYSLGCVLFQCLTGTRPFDVEGLPALMHAHLTLDPPAVSNLRSDLPSCLDDVIKRAMQKKPEDRYATAGALGAAARSALAPSPAAATPQSTQGPASDAVGGSSNARPGVQWEEVADSAVNCHATPAESDAAAVLAAVGASATPRSSEPSASGVPDVMDPQALKAPSPARPRVPEPRGPAPSTRTPHRSEPAPGTAIRDADRAGGHQPPPGPPPPRNGNGRGESNGRSASDGWTGIGAFASRLDPEPERSRRRLPALVVGALAVVVVLVVAIVVGSSLFSTPSAPTPVGGSSAIPLTPVAPTLPSLDQPTVGATFSVGNGPEAIALSPDGTRAYVTGESGSNVLNVIDTAHGNLLATVPAPGPPQFIVLDPSGTHGYVTLYDPTKNQNAVAVFDVAKNAFTAVIPTGEERPFGLGISTDGGKLYVPNHDSGEITVIDTATQTVTSQIAVPESPHWIAFNPTGRIAYAANHHAGLVTVLDTKTDTVLTTIPIGNMVSPHSIAVTPDGRRVEVTNYDGNSVSIIDTSTNRVTATIPVGVNPQSVAFSRDGKHSYIVNNGSNTVSVVNTDTAAITATIPVGTSPWMVAVSPDGHHGYVTSKDSSSVMVLNLDSSVPGAVPAPAAPAAPVAPAAGSEHHH